MMVIRRVLVIAIRIWPQENRVWGLRVWSRMWWWDSTSRRGHGSFRAVRSLLIVRMTTAIRGMRMRTSTVRILRQLGGRSDALR